MKQIRKIAALILSVVLVFSLLPTTTLAATFKREAFPKVVNSGYAPTPSIERDPLVEMYLQEKDQRTGNTRAAEQELPEKYDAREHGYLPTTVRDQEKFNCCWTFGAIGPIEASLVKHQVINKKTGLPFTTNINLSEYHLTYFNYTDSYDPLGMLVGDTTHPYDENSENATYDSAGGNGMMATMTLMRWTGPASEEIPALAFSHYAEGNIDASYAYQADVAHVESVEWVPTGYIDEVKRCIMEYGAGSVNAFLSGSFFNSQYNTYCYKQTAAPGSEGYDYPAHVLTLIGWDDTIPASHFNYANNTYGPSSDGAWIVKNSWGPSRYPYFYISYEDTATLNDLSYFYKLASVDNYDNNYQYDGTSNTIHRANTVSGGCFANIFTANGSELLEAVAINNYDLLVDYTVDIYKNLTDPDNPISGVKVSTQSGQIRYAGYHTIPLETAVPLDAGDTFSVVFTLSVPYAKEYEAQTGEPYFVAIGCDHSGNSSYASWIHADRPSVSFVKGTEEESWMEDGAYTLRIKAYTKNDPNHTIPTYTVSALSNNDDWGVVSVNESTIIANPAAGYYVAGYEVLDGNAVCTINGNTINVSAASDCTVKILFAPIPDEEDCTVTFVADGIVLGSQSVVQNTVISLPAEISCVFEGWTFCGWMEQQLEETTDTPTFYAPGAAYAVDGNATLFALFTRTEGLTETAYQLMTEAPDTWEGNYVITYTANADTMRVLKGITTTSISCMSLEGCAATLSSTGMTLNQNLLTNVDPVYQFTISAHNGSYWIQNVSTGSYIGGTTVLYASTQTYVNVLPWVLSFSNGAAHLKNNYKGNSLTYNTSIYFNLGTPNSNICLWKESPVGTTYYSTVIGFTEHAHDLTYTPASAATCTAQGHTAYYYCAGCGLYFSDPNAESVIALADTVLPALGHNPSEAVTENQVAPTCGAEGSYDVVAYCLRCNAEISRQHHTVSATGNHSYGAWSPNGNGAHTRTCSTCGNVETVACSYEDVVTAPTTTEQGYTTHTCTVCGDSFVDSYTAPLGTSYLISYSVPSGVAPVASMTCNSNSSIMLPVANAPAGYTFLGWVTASVSETETIPSNILTGSYHPTGNVTLHALYSYSSYQGVAYERVPYELADWSGKYVITYGTGTSTPYVLKGLSGNTSYQNTTCGGSMPLVSTGISIENNRLTGVTSDYVFTFAPQGSYYTIRNNGTGTYLGSYSRALYSRTSYNSLYCRWSIYYNSGNFLLKSTIYPLYPYLSFSSSRYFMMAFKTVNTIYLWKESSVYVTYYTTG